MFKIIFLSSNGINDRYIFSLSKDKTGEHFNSKALFYNSDTRVILTFETPFINHKRVYFVEKKLWFFLKSTRELASKGGESSKIECEYIIDAKASYSNSEEFIELNRATFINPNDRNLRSIDKNYPQHVDSKEQILNYNNGQFFVFTSKVKGDNDCINVDKSINNFTTFLVGTPTKSIINDWTFSLHLNETHLPAVSFSPAFTFPSEKIEKRIVNIPIEVPQLQRVFGERQLRKTNFPYGYQNFVELIDFYFDFTFSYTLKENGSIILNDFLISRMEIVRSGTAPWLVSGQKETISTGNLIYFPNGVSTGITLSQALESISNDTNRRILAIKPQYIINVTLGNKIQIGTIMLDNVIAYGDDDIPFNFDKWDEIDNIKLCYNNNFIDLRKNDFEKQTTIKISNVLKPESSEFSITLNTGIYSNELYSGSSGLIDLTQYVLVSALDEFLQTNRNAFEIYQSNRQFSQSQQRANMIGLASGAAVGGLVAGGTGSVGGLIGAVGGGLLGGLTAGMRNRASLEHMDKQFKLQMDNIENSPANRYGGGGNIFMTNNNAYGLWVFYMKFNDFNVYRMFEEQGFNVNLITDVDNLLNMITNKGYLQFYATNTGLLPEQQLILDDQTSFYYLKEIEDEKEEVMNL